MLVACRLAGLSALEAYYAGVSVGAMRGDAALLKGMAGERRRAPGMRTNAGQGLNGCQYRLGGAGTGGNFPIRRFAKRGPVLRASADGQSRIERRRRVSLPDENGSGGE
jgi:hypothetical protein